MNMKELFEKMEKVVKENMTAYETDFYKYDMKTLEEAKEDDVFYWFVRRTGTQLMGRNVLVKGSDTNYNFKYWHSHAIKIYKIVVGKQGYELIEMNKKKLWNYVIKNERDYKAVVVDVKFKDKNKDEVKNLEITKDSIDKHGTLLYAIAHRLRELKELVTIEEIKKIYNIRYILV